MGQLLWHPGALTLAFVAGKRVLYMQPLRLFLTLSVILFALLQFSGFSIGNDAPKGSGPAFHADIRETGRASAPLPAGTHVHALPLGYYRLALVRTPDDVTAGFTLTLPDTDRPSFVLAALRRLSPGFQQKLLRFGALPPADKAERMTHGFFARMPYVIFCMVPVFALLLKLLYPRSRRPYGEYLLFALHVNAFAFFVMACMAAMPWSRGLAVLALWLLVYLGRAMQNVYGGAPLLTAARCLLLALAYLLALLFVISQVMLVMAMSAV
jgi:hypothetical protein